MATTTRAALGLTVLATFWGVVAPGRASVPLFTSISRVLDTNLAPQSIVAADFDSDSHQDIALTFAIDDRLFLYRGLGDGSFAAPLILHDLGQPGPLCVADFDGDGHVDLAVSQASDDYVTILFGTGAGQFDRSVDAVVTSNAAAVAASDLNGDGSVDLALACNGAVDVLLNTNEGTTWTRSQYAYTGPTALALADLDGDGDADMVVGSSGSYDGHSFALTVYRNPGNGQFDGGTLYFLSNGSGGVAVGEMTGDGFVDIVTPAAILPGTGNATFGPPMIYEPAGGAALALADFDGNGLLDVVHAWIPAIYLNQGNGTTGPPVRLATGYSPDALAVADFNDDGRLDAAFANRSGASVTVLLASASGLPGEHTYLGGLWGAMRHADMNGDSREDLVCASNTSVTLSLGRGDGTFEVARVTELSDYITALTIADMDADGHPDVVAGVDDSVLVLRGDGTGDLSIQSQAYAGHSTTGVAVGDVNNDGRPDIAVSLRGETYCDYDFDCWYVDTDSARVLLATASGGFVGTPAVHTAVEPSGVALADFDGDGLLDLVTVDAGRWRSGYVGGDSISVFRGRGNGAFLARRAFFAGRHPTIMRVDDVTGDSLIDVVVGNGADTNSFYGLDAGTGISTLMGLGNGAFLPPMREPSNSACVAIDLADLDGDGLQDIVGTFYYSASARVLLGRHTGPVLADFFGTLSNPYWITAFDATSDGRPDILVAGFPSDSLSLHRGLALPVSVSGDGTARPGPVVSLVPSVPHNGAYAIRVVVDRPSTLSSSIHDVSGRCIATLANGLPAAHECVLHWNGVDASARPVPSGVYVWRVAVGSVTRAVRVVVVR